MALPRLTVPAILKKPVVHYVGLGLVLVLVGWLGIEAMRSHAAETSGRWMQSLRYADTTIVRNPDTTYVQVHVPASFGTTEQAARLSEQLNQIQRHARFHLAVVSYFYGRYFTSITMATILAIIAAVCLLHITKRGWDDADGYVVTIFLVVAGAALVFRLSPALYRQNENITANKALYTQYINLDNTIRTYLVTHRIGPQSDTVPVSTFLLWVDEQLQKLNNLPIGFDETQVPTVQQVEMLPRRPGPESP